MSEEAEKNKDIPETISPEATPENCWKKIEGIFLDDSMLRVAFASLEIASEDARVLSDTIGKILLKISASVQATRKWNAVQIPINWGHRVQLSLTPDGLRKPIELTVDMGEGKIGIESRLLGKSASSVDSKISFNVQKLMPNHPLYFSAGRNLVANVIVQKVFEPPFRLARVPSTDKPEELKSSLLKSLRTIPFSDASEFSLKLKEANLQGQSGSKLLQATRQFLDRHASVPGLVRRVIAEFLNQAGKVDAERELDFVRRTYGIFTDSDTHYDSPQYKNIVKQCMDDIVRDTLRKVMRQFQAQQDAIHNDIRSFSGLMQENKRLENMLLQFEQNKKKGVGQEILQRDRHEINQVMKRIRRIQFRQQTDMGVILMHEMYLSTLQNMSEIKELIDEQSEKFKEIKSLIRANHVTMSSDIDKFTRKLGVHASQLLVQHAIYKDVEPALDKIQSLDDLGNYNREEVQGVLGLLPTLSKKLGDKDFDSTTLLKATLQTKVPEKERKAFDNFLENNDEPANHNVQRLTSQMSSFFRAADAGSSIDDICKVLEAEAFRMKFVVQFAMENQKMTTDFKNHMVYYQKVYIEPFMELVSKEDPERAAEIEDALDRTKNALKSQMTLKYSVADEKAMLSMFRVVGNQLAKDDLFTTNVFQRQVRSFINFMTGQKKKISADLVKRILTTYTVFMMACSRLANLAKSDTGRLSIEDLARIRSAASSLVK